MGEGSVTPFLGETMFRLVIYEDPNGYFAWRLDGPRMRGNSQVHALAPHSWRTKEMAMQALVEVRMRMATAILVDETSLQ